MRTALLALVFLCHGLCVEARITSSSPVLNRSGELPRRASRTRWFANPVDKAGPIWPHIALGGLLR